MSRDDDRTRGRDVAALPASQVDTGPATTETKATDLPDDPDALRREIEHTRRDLGDTVEALAQKADVKSQVKERVEERKESFRQTGEQAKTTVSTQANERGAQIAAGAIVALILLLFLRKRRR